MALAIPPPDPVSLLVILERITEEWRELRKNYDAIPDLEMRLPDGQWMSKRFQSTANYATHKILDEKVEEYLLAKREVAEALRSPGNLNKADEDLRYRFEVHGLVF